MSRSPSLIGHLEGLLWLHAGRWLDRKGMSSLAGTCYRYGLEGQSKYAGEAGLSLGQQLLSRKSYPEAITVFQEALRDDPDHEKLWCALGAAQRRLAHMEAARASYEKAVEIDPGYAQAWSNLGEWWMVKGELTTALDKFEQALLFEPRLLEALNNRSAVLYELGQFKESETAAREAIELYPHEAALHVNLGNVLLHTGKARLAVKAMHKALELDPTCSEAHLGLATMLGENHHLAESLTFLEHEIAIKGKSAQRLASLALAQQSKGDWQAAETTCNEVLDMQPNNISALIILAGCLSARADHGGAIRLHERALAENPNMPGICSNIAFNATYLPDISAVELFDYHRRWAQRFEKDDKTNRYSYDQSKVPERPLRIGYVSGDFGTHPVGFLLRDVIRNHDRQQCYIHCYSMMRSSDNITAAIRENADSWIDALLMSDEELAEQIHQDRIDILVDLSGHTAYNRLPTFVLRPAPVQATWIGYFHSTGLESIDYFITDPYTTPVGCKQLFSEIPVYLPNSRFCFSPAEYAPEVVPPPSITNGRITFGSFNRAEKLVEPVIAAWARILKAVPESRLLLKAGALEGKVICDKLRDRFGVYGLEGDRLELQGPSAHHEMLEQYGEMDIALDPFPFNGGMTTLEALWMGVPVVTLEGNSVVSRQTFSALANLGLTELAYPDIESYVQGAIALASAPTRLARLRSEIRPRMTASPIRQPVKFTRDLEQLYRRMWHSWCKGERLKSDVTDWEVETSFIQ